MSREDERTLERVRRQQGLCRTCGEPAGGRYLCAAHLARSNGAQRTRKQRRIARGLPPTTEAERGSRSRYKKRCRVSWGRLGLCRGCGRILDGDYQTCVRCRERRRRNKPTEAHRQALRDAGLCTACGKTNDSPTTTCSTCKAKVSRARNAVVARYREQGLCSCGERPQSVGLACEECWFKARARDCAGSTSQWQALRLLLIAQGFCCAYSGKRLELGPDATIDHKVPRSRGGSNDISNLQWVSRRVNSMKTDFTHEEFIAACRIIAEKWPKKQNQRPIALAPKSMPISSVSRKSMAG